MKFIRQTRDRRSELAGRSIQISKRWAMQALSSQKGGERLSFVRILVSINDRYPNVNLLNDLSRVPLGVRFYGVPLGSLSLFIGMISMNPSRLLIYIQTKHDPLPSAAVNYSIFWLKESRDFLQYHAGPLLYSIPCHFAGPKIYVNFTIGQAFSFSPSLFIGMISMNPSRLLIYYM